MSLNVSLFAWRTIRINAQNSVYYIVWDRPVFSYAYSSHKMKKKNVCFMHSKKFTYFAVDYVIRIVQIFHAILNIYRFTVMRSKIVILNSQ